LLRDLVFAKVCPEPGTLLDLPAEETREVQELARAGSTDDLVRLHQGFAAGYDEVVKSGQPRAALEMLLVRLARRPPLVPIDDLVGRLGAMERRLGSGGPLPGRERPPAVRAEAETPKAVAPKPREPRPSTPSERAPLAEAAPVRTSDPPREPKKDAAPPVPVAGESTPPSDPLDTWREVVDRIGIDRPDLAAFLARAAALEAGPGSVVLAFTDDDPSAVETERNLELIAKAATQHFDVATKVRVVKDSALMKTKRTLAGLNSEEGERQRRAAIAKVKNHPRVTEAVEVLGARIKDLKLGER
jgi:DNA polymerase-3 subunit gamma/tau